MSTPYLGEIRLMAFGFAPDPPHWAQCNGQFLPINQNQPLFALLGTVYGGDGRTTFALPDLRGRVPVHQFGDWPIGTRLGEELHTVTQSEMPQHIHPANASTQNANSSDAENNVLGAATNFYGPATQLSTLHPATVPNAGGGQAHENRSPFTTLSWCIALQGIFPSQT
jgi:microcystin-dependent protein